MAASEPPQAAGAEKCGNYANLIEKYAWDAHTACAVALAESGADASKTGDLSLTFTQNGRQYGYSVSLFQVRILPGREGCDSHNPEINVACAYKIWQTQGWRAWSTVINGTYLKYM